VLASLSGPFASTSRFLVVNLKRFRAVQRITLRGSFSFDALSPDASRLYLIQYTHGRRGDLSHYIVRGYDLRTNRLLPGRIADRTQRSWVMKGSPLARTWSAHGRWVYTLYTNPGGYPFVHALDTKRGVAHCIQLPWDEDRSQVPLYNLVLDVRNGGRTLAVHWKNGKPWVRIAVGNWRIQGASTGFPWTWVGVAIGGGLVLLAAGALLLRRRRREELDQRAGQELGLA
jgi:MYXO-CTERM domain-containing protein